MGCSCDKMRYDCTSPDLALSYLSRTDFHYRDYRGLCACVYETFPGDLELVECQTIANTGDARTSVNRYIGEYLLDVG